MIVLNWRVYNIKASKLRVPYYPQELRLSLTIRKIIITLLQKVKEKEFSFIVKFIYIYIWEIHPSSLVVTKL